ncbi:MAG: hypothetical protein RLZZ488_776 [Pseudomonadota bacterium]
MDALLLKKHDDQSIDGVSLFHNVKLEFLEPRLLREKVINVMKGNCLSVSISSERRKITKTLILTGLLIPQGYAAANDKSSYSTSEQLRNQRSYFLGIKGSETFESLGFEIGKYGSDNEAYGFNMQVHSILATSHFFGLFKRWYLGNSFHTQMGLGYGVSYNWEKSKQSGLGVYLAIGNEWHFSSGLIIGCDWLSVNGGWGGFHDNGGLKYFGSGGLLELKIGLALDK